jgi:hypothetical protein
MEKKEIDEKEIDALSLLKEIEEKSMIELKALTYKMCEKSLINIMKKGEDEFIKKTGRHMTYSEMRQAYG